MACSVAAETWSFGKASCRHGHNFCTVTWIYTAWVRFLALTFKVHYFAGHRKKKFEDSLGIPQSLAFVTLLGTSLSRLVADVIEDDYEDRWLRKQDVF